MIENRRRPRGAVPRTIRGAADASSVVPRRYHSCAIRITAPGTHIEAHKRVWASEDHQPRRRLSGIAEETERWRFDSSLRFVSGLRKISLQPWSETSARTAAAWNCAHAATTTAKNCASLCK